MKKILNITVLCLMSFIFFSCGSPEQKAEKEVKKYLQGTYTLTGEKNGHYFKEITIKHLEKNIYRISCTYKDEILKDRFGKETGEIRTKTPDIFDVDIYSFETKGNSDSIQEYVVKYYVTNVVENGTTISSANYGIGENSGLEIKIFNNKVGVIFWGMSQFYSERKK
ncbi:MAG: hypothetical protein ACRDB9_08455 [Cetobacterium sp.]